MKSSLNLASQNIIYLGGFPNGLIFGCVCNNNISILKMDIVWTLVSGYNVRNCLVRSIKNASVFY